MHVTGVRLGILLTSLAGSILSLGDTPAIVNARVETRSAASGLERALRTIAAQQTQPAWIGYAVPAVGKRHMCCFNSDDGIGASGCAGCRLEDGGAFATPEVGAVRLEPSRELVVLLRVEQGRVGRIRSLSADCAVDAGGLPFYWLTEVKPADSLTVLASFVATVDIEGDKAGRKRSEAAIAAMAHHDGQGADAVLQRFVGAGQPEGVRKKAAFWLGHARARPGYEILRRLVHEDGSERFREHAVFALSQSEVAGAVDVILEVARRDASARVRSRALFWLAHKGGKKATGAITQAIEGDAETEVKKQAVFALSQLPRDEGVPLLIQVARTHRSPEVRKKAMFWLGQSKDPRALVFFEEVLKRK